jgi:hypothetical protein
MSAEYKTVSKAKHFMELAEPVVIEQHETTRRVILVGINDAKQDIGETISITLVHQRKKGNDKWEDINCINLNTLKGGEGVKISLDSKATKTLFDKLSELYSLAKEKGVEQGINQFTVAKADEIVKVDVDRKLIIESLLSENYGNEVWEQLIQKDPDLATKLSDAKVYADRKKALKVFKTHLDQNNDDESFWQEFFKNNTWIFGYGLNYQFLDILKDQPHLGGVNYTGSGAQRGDYLGLTQGFVRFTVLVEIKTPATKLFTYIKTQVEKNRNGSCLLSRFILGGVSQVQINCKTWTENSQLKINANKLEKNNSYTVQPKGILIIGNTSELVDNEDKINTFEEYRRNIYNPEIITFDELYQRAKYIVECKSIVENNDPHPNPEDDLPF